MGADGRIVAWQLGRPPREPWRVCVRCDFGYPQVIASPSRLDDGTPFPTLFYLTCPYLVAEASALEAAGASKQWAERLRADESLARAMRVADTAYREARASESGGVDACADVGIAGQRDPLGTKCLHAHTAAALAGINDPVGRDVVASAGARCNDARCSEGEQSCG
ncbi:MAG: DUF501 domain-containing protein [Actinomycetia bacterium]|nr:DUF501 domain-containing protein [Actinomycetes bacterium]